jgi:hypothetical protein
MSATGGGNIAITGTGGTSGTTQSNYINDATVSAGAGNLTITGNTLYLAGTISGAGELIIQPQTAGTTIGIAGGTGTLSLPSDAFSTHFADGFSGITIGSATSGLISIGSSALSYLDRSH